MDDTGDVGADTTVQEDQGRGAFVLHVDGVEAGHVDVRRRKDRIVLVHTEVDEAYGGRGLAGRLVRAVFEAARSEGVALVPLCPYAQRWLGSHPEYLADVPLQTRQELGLPEPEMAGEEQ